MPEYVVGTTEAFGCPDNKHEYIQVSIQALADVESTVTMELLHGQERLSKQWRSDGVHPSKSSGTIPNDKHYQFYAMLLQADTDSCHLTSGKGPSTHSRPSKLPY
jgi:hypothetical protein